MTASASLDSTEVTAAPGAETTVPLRVRNGGTTVEEYRFEVVGACADWSVVEPPTLSLYPDTGGTVVVRLTAPRTAQTRAGRVPFGIRVVPTSAPDQAVVPEGTVTVLPFTDVTAELVPRGSDGAWRGRHRVAVDNRGNVPMSVRFVAQTTADRARVTVPTEPLVIQPGRAQFAAVTARPARRMWRGAPITHTFQVAVVVTPGVDDPKAADAPTKPATKPGADPTPSSAPAATGTPAVETAAAAPTAPVGGVGSAVGAGGAVGAEPGAPARQPGPEPAAAPGPPAPPPPEPVLVDGTYQQAPILPTWLPYALTALVVVVGVLVGLWYSLLRPVVRSAARDAVTPEAVQSAVAANNEADRSANQGAPGGDRNGATGPGGTNTSPGGENGTGGGSAPGGGAAPGGGSGPQSTTAPGGTAPGTGNTPGTPGAPENGAGPATPAPTSARIQVTGGVGSPADSSYQVPQGRSFALTDLVVQNPQGDAGTLVIATNQQPLLQLALENFRDQDYHFVTPIVVEGGGRVSLTVTCREIGTPVGAPKPSGCAESLLLGGTLSVATTPAR